MRIILTILIIIVSLSSYGKDSIKLKADSLPQRLIVIDSNKNEQTEIVDTISLELSNNELILPLSQNNLTRVILLKEKGKVDWLKYLLPILSLILGIWIKELLEKRSNKKKIIKDGERWIAELRSIEEPIKLQIKSLEEFLEEHIKEEFHIPRIQIYSSLNGEIFKSLDKNNLIQFIELNNSKKEFKEIVKISNRTNGYVSVLVHLHESLEDWFKKYLSGTSTHVTSLNSSLLAFNNAFRDYGVELEKELNSDPYLDDRYKPIVDLFSDQILPYLGEENFNPFVLREEFFKPLIPILGRLRLDDRTKDLALSMTAGLNAIKGLTLEKQYLTDNINTIIKHYKEQLAKLNSILSNIEKV